MIRSELFWFGIVGSGAFLVHFLMVSLVLVPAGLSPLFANSIGFIIAFQVSYWGHQQLTFPSNSALQRVSTHRRSAPRFLVVSSISFILNDLLFAALLRYTALDYRIALLIVLFSMAAFTFVLAKRWAFLHTKATA